MENSESKNRSLCYLCGKTVNRVTRDHIFPKNLFPVPRPSNLPTAPACEPCNNSLSDDEELFRVMMTGGQAFETKTGNRIWTDRIRPSLKDNRRGIKSHLKRNLKWKEIVTPGGLYLGLEGGIEFPRQRIDSVVKKIAKGLIYLDVGEAAPDDVEIKWDYSQFEPEKFLEPPLDEAFRSAKRTDFGDDVISCWRYIIAGDPTMSMNWIVFYRNTTLFVETYRHNAIAEVA